MEWIQFKAEHISMMQVQLKQSINSGTYEEYLIVEKSSEAYTLMDNQNKPLAVIGGILINDQRVFVWTVLSSEAKSHMIRITKEIVRKLNKLEYARLEMTVEDNFEEAHRWAKMLGFECETPNGMKNFYKGNTHYLYSRLKK